MRLSLSIGVPLSANNVSTWLHGVTLGPVPCTLSSPTLRSYLQGVSQKSIHLFFSHFLVKLKLENFIRNSWDNWSQSASVIKCRRYAAQMLRQAKSRKFEFLETNYGKTLHEMSKDFTLLKLLVFNPVNKQNTTLCVLRQQIFILLASTSEPHIEGI